MSDPGVCACRQWNLVWTCRRNEKRELCRTASGRAFGFHLPCKAAARERNHSEEQALIHDSEKCENVGERAENCFFLFRITCMCKDKKAAQMWRPQLLLLSWRDQNITFTSQKRKYAHLNTLVQWTCSSSRVVDRQI